VLAAAVTPEAHATGRGSDGRIAAQALRVDILGHLVYFSSDVRARLDSAEISPAEARRAGLPWPLSSDQTGARPSPRHRHGLPPVTRVMRGRRPDLARDAAARRRQRTRRAAGRRRT
jgi:hypothetical protein